MGKAKIEEILSEYLESNDDNHINTLVVLFNDYCSAINDYEAYLHDNERYELEAIFGHDIDKALMAALYGEYEYNAPYFYIDVYGCLQSIRRVQDYIGDYYEELVDYYTEQPQTLLEIVGD